jgi:hypothetical protein
MPWFPDFIGAVERARRQQSWLAKRQAWPVAVVDALQDGDTEAIVSTFSSDGYFRESLGTHRTHRGVRELRSFFASLFDAGRVGPQPQAGIGVFERGLDGSLAAVRAYDDVETPVDLEQAAVAAAGTLHIDGDRASG